MSVEIKMPTLSPTMTKGLIARWLVNIGDEVKDGDIIAEVETDKVTVEIEAEQTGVVSEICASEGSEVPVDSIIVKLAATGSEIAPTSIPAPVTTKITAPTENTVVEDEAVTSSETIATVDNALTTNLAQQINISPLARRMVEQSQLDISQLIEQNKGSGAKGKIVKRDIEKLMGFDPTKSSTTEVKPTETINTIDVSALPEAQEIANSGMRNVVASRLTESSRDIPHFYMTVDCELDALLKLRKELNNKDNIDYKISVNDFVIKAVALAMKKVPEANSMWAGDHVKRFNQVDISVAVAIEDGLITPVIRNVNGLGLAEMSNQAKQLINAATEGKLKPTDYQGGTFTISNLGMYGVKSFTSIINPPQNGILSVGMGEQRAVVKDSALTIATVMSVTLAMDHRCVDGVTGAKFLQAFKAIVEDPITLML